MNTSLNIVLLQPLNKPRQVISFDFMIEDIINHGDLTCSYKPFSGFYSEDKIPLIEGDNVLCKGLNNDEQLSGIVTFDRGAFSLLVVDPPKDGSFDNGSLPAMYNFQQFILKNLAK
jgi:hypothetical protein